MKIQLNKSTSSTVLPAKSGLIERSLRLTLPRVIGFSCLVSGLLGGTKAVAFTKNPAEKEEPGLHALSAPFISTQQFSGNISFEPRNSIVISWLPNPPEGLLGYRVYSTGPSELRISNVISTGLAITGKLDNVDLHMVSVHRVTAVNVVGLESDPSDPCVFWQGMVTAATRQQTSQGTQVSLQFERLATVPYAAGFLYRTNPAHKWQHVQSFSMNTVPLQNGLVQETFALTFGKTLPDSTHIYLKQGVIGTAGFQGKTTAGQNLRVLSVD
jgi:hypothetical protein